MKHILSLLVFELCAITAVAASIYWVQKYCNGFKWEDRSFETFNYHPVFMLLGLVFLMGHSVITFRILPLRHRAKKYIHASINMLAFIFVVVGLMAVFKFHNDLNIPNMYSLHSWLGMTTVIIFSLQLLGGVSIFQDMCTGAKDELRAAYKPFHVAAGTAMALFVVASVCTGLQEKMGFKDKNPNFKYNSMPPEGILVNTLGLVVMMWGATVVWILVAVEKRSPVNHYEEIQPESDDVQTESAS